VNRNPKAGFTLVELAVVLLILAVATAILLPTLPRLTGSERTTAVRRLALQIRETHEEASFKKKA
jgi:prepilin-type N-terminal cleavage/methylation domain-containing protein